MNPPEQKGRMNFGRTGSAGKEDLLKKSRGLDMVRDGRLFNSDGTFTEKPMGYPYFRRMGWQSRE